MSFWTHYEINLETHLVSLAHGLVEGVDESLAGLPIFRIARHWEGEVGAVHGVSY